MNVRPGQRAVIVQGDCKGTKVHVIGEPTIPHPDQWWSCVSLGGPLRAELVQNGRCTGLLCDTREADIADEALRPLIDPDQVETIVVDDVLKVPRESEGCEVLTR